MTQPLILILGGTGATGAIIVQMALQQGLPVRLLVRDPSKVPPATGALEVMQGNILNLGEVNRAVAGVDVVIWTIGHENTRSAKATMAMDTCSRGTTHVVAAMQRQGVSRIVAITSWGVGRESRQRTPFFFRNVVFGMVLNKEFADKEKQENLLRESGLHYTLIKPSRLTNGATARVPVVGEHLAYTHFSHTPRQVLAAFILEEALAPHYDRKTIEISV